MLAIKITLNDGTISRMYPIEDNRLGGETDTEFFSRIATKDCPQGASWVLCQDTDFHADPVPVPQTISRRQFFQHLANLYMITRDEALAAMKSGTIPTALATMIDALPADQKFNAEMILVGATEFQRDHPLVSMFASSMNLSSSDIDTFWTAAAAL